METDVKLEKTNENSSNNHILYRGLSIVSTNKILVNNQRNILAKNYRRTSINNEIITIDHDDADALFILPNLYELSEDIRKRIMNNLIDMKIMKSLEDTHRLNWWIDEKFSYPKLYPLITCGDGNCLLHATSIAMWGFHDHALSMRKALNDTLITSKPNNSLYRRWRWSQSIQNKQYDLIFSEDEWNEEWKNLLRLSSIEPRLSQKKSRIQKFYQSLEEFHVYVLANNIRRPIIIYSNTILRDHHGQAISPIEFGGIYLPLEIPPDKCHKQPIFLAFNIAHFSALVPMESKDIYQIPLIDFDTLDLLPIHFLIDPGLDFQWPINEALSDEKISIHTNHRENSIDILEKYLNISKTHSTLTNFLSLSTIIQDNQSSIVDKDLSNENNNNNKKFSLSTLNLISKNFRRKIFEPFSSTKRISSKHHLTIPNEIPVQIQKSSPLLNRHKNSLTIILTNFQPKRPKTSDDMIKNYIKTCIKEYQSGENFQTMLYYRHHPSIETIQNIEEINEKDDYEDLLSIKNRQFSTNIDHVKQKSNQLIQNNNTNDQHDDHESHMNWNSKINVLPVKKEDH